MQGLKQISSLNMHRAVVIFKLQINAECELDQSRNSEAWLHMTQCVCLQDVQYADIDHYDERKVFTIDNESFAGLPEYFKSLHEQGIRTIIILVSCQKKINI